MLLWTLGYVYLVELVLLFSSNECPRVGVLGIIRSDQISRSVMSDSVRPHRWQPTRLPVPGIPQARTLEWVAISFSSAWKWKVKVKSLSRVELLATPWTAAYQALPSMLFSRQEYWSGLPLPFLMLDTIDKITSKNHRKFYCTELI